MDEDDCFPSLLSQRERSTLQLGIQRVSKAEVTDFSGRHDLSEDDFLAESTGPAKTVPTPQDESPPAA
ncbi:hypothetical protein [Streptomyces sp. JHA26]|uniref:hypothetical protein n=1 Tax=Streptomyces sp. JHA26 TaxID=1917143 RepID=UPI00098A27B1|nr:hypothetical protein [Streptomyces sp. JHA26]